MVPSLGSPESLPASNDQYVDHVLRRWFNTRLWKLHPAWPDATVQRRIDFFHYATVRNNNSESTSVGNVTSAASFLDHSEGKLDLRGVLVLAMQPFGIG